MFFFFAFSSFAVLRVRSSNRVMFLLHDAIGQCSRKPNSLPLAHRAIHVFAFDKYVVNKTIEVHLLCTINFSTPDPIPHLLLGVLGSFCLIMYTAKLNNVIQFKLTFYVVRYYINFLFTKTQFFPDFSPLTIS